MSDLVQVCALWKNKTKEGKDYLSGYLGDAKVLIFANKHKRAGSKDPDCHMYLSPGKRQQERQARPAAPADAGDQSEPPPDPDGSYT